ncbi:hypothetical protein [Lacticaseibacillus paracasei]|uniref:hypothetical protein n=1 Tax=Lacticaseibacillus paracasei TaxID=1597 RepID=UPI0025A07791|nr:hypothetical protein [Lacticaseibacillus paracasei]MDM7531406.1 hypothetical protein [Lacticaseibacillus paracasei]
MTGALLIVVTTQLAQPVNLIVDAILVISLLLINAALGGWMTIFTMIYILYMLAVIAGVWLFRKRHS